MTISSALNASVMGLNVNSTRLATIADNISNSATFGYKRSDVDFSSMVINQSRSIYSAGGVRAESFKDISGQGALISTGNSTDISIGGRGLIPVTDEFGITETSTQRALQFLPTGSFSADENGFLRTLSGLHLLGWPAGTDGVISNVSRDSGTGLVPVNVNISQFSASPTNLVNLGVNLPAESTLSTASGDPFTLPVEYFDNLGRAQNLVYTFTPVINPAGPTNAWNISVTDGAGDPAVSIADFGLTFNDSTADGGSIASVTPGAGMSYNAATGQVTFNVAKGPINTFIGRIGDNAGITQLSAPFSPYNVNKDGSPIGDLQSVEIDAQGFLEAVYDTGFRRVIYQIPVADVPNLNGLEALNNQAYAVSQASGDVYFWDAGTGPVGTLVGFALMESTTDIATELTNLIETQRAYSSNAKIVQTVDEMLQETTNLKR